MGQQFFLQLSSEPADRHARPDWFGRMPGRTNRILVTAAGVTHRSQLAYWLRDGGCIDRLQDGIVGRRRGESTDRSLEHQKRSQTDVTGQRLAAEVGLRA